MNLHQKLVKIREAVGCLSKDQEGYDYNYVTGNQILSKAKDKMNELNVLLVPSAEVGEWAQYDYTTSTGKSKTDFIVWGNMSYTWIDGDNPEDKIAIPWGYYGQQDDISKAYGSALTYSERYFWLKMLGLPTDEDDPDGRQGQEKSGKGSNRPRGQNSQNKPRNSSNSGFSNNPGKVISDKQVKRMFALSEGDEEIIKGAAKAVGYDDYKQVNQKDYDEVCKRIVAGSMAQTESEEHEQESEEGSNDEGGPMITPAQTNALMSLAKNFNYKPADMKKLISERYSKGSSKELTSKEAEDLIAHIEANEIGEEAV